MLIEIAGPFCPVADTQAGIAEAGTEDCLHVGPNLGASEQPGDPVDVSSSSTRLERAQDQRCRYETRGGQGDGDDHDGDVARIGDGVRRESNGTVDTENQC